MNWRNSLFIPLIPSIMGVAAAAVLDFTVSADAAEHKLFRQGKWQIDSVLEIGGKQFKRSESTCTDPNIQYEDFLTSGKNGFGCSWGDAIKNGNQYKISEKCSGVITGYKNMVLTVDSDSAYTETTEEALGKMTDKSSTTARRVGDCHR